MDAIEHILAALGGLAAVIVAIVTACFGLFRMFGEKWMTAKFDAKLAAYKHEQQKELEQLKFKISSLLDRTTKLHQREFEVLPEAWAKLVDAYYSTVAVTSPLQTYPDLDKVPTEQLKEFLEKCALEAWEKKELSNTVNKTEYYREHIFWHKLSKAKESCAESYRYLERQGVFIRTELRKQFSLIGDLLWSALNEHELNQQMKLIPRISERSDELRSTGESLMKDLDAAVQHRLWDSATDISV